MTNARMTVRFVSVVLAAVLVGRAAAVDPELERLKAAASKARATLVVRQSTYRRRDRDVDQFEFRIDTGARQYAMRYKTFRGDDARLNAKELNDWSSGYGMVAPQQNWYHNGFVQVSLSGAKATSIRFTQGQPRVLAATGPRVAYDLIFADEAGTVVVRTVALAGREELFLSVGGKPAPGEGGLLQTTFCGYPLGFKPPFDRWVHRDGQDIPNAGKERKQFMLDLQGAPWLLLADHRLDPEGSKQGLLGLVYDKSVLTQAAVLHNRNYAILPAFTGPAGATQRYTVYTFGAMRWQDARARLLRVSDAGDLFEAAFADLPPVAGE